jgi:hypothetical protein
VTKLTPTGVLAYSTYLGGGGADHGFAIAADGGGNAYVTGFTISGDFPLVNAADPTLGGPVDAFVTKLASEIDLGRASALTVDPPVAGLFTLRARLADAASGAPIPGRTVVMTTGGGPVCQASTDADGVATCSGLGAAVQILAENGYTASFAGDAQYLPVSARAALLTGGRGFSPTTTPPTTGPPIPTSVTTGAPGRGQLPATGGDGTSIWLLGGLLAVWSAVRLRRHLGTSARNARPSFDRVRCEVRHQPGARRG